MTPLGYLNIFLSSSCRLFAGCSRRDLVNPAAGPSLARSSGDSTRRRKPSPDDAPAAGLFNRRQ